MIDGEKREDKFQPPVEVRSFCELIMRFYGLTHYKYFGLRDFSITNYGGMFLKIETFSWPPHKSTSIGDIKEPKWHTCFPLVITHAIDLLF